MTEPPGRGGPAADTAPDSFPVTAKPALATPPLDEAAADIDEQEIHLFLLGGRLLLEYGEATPMVERTLYRVAASLGREIRITASYRDLTIFLRCGDHFEGRVSRFTPELKVDMRTITEVQDLLRRLECRQATLDATIAALEQLTDAPPPMNRWYAAAMLGMAAASLAGIFGGDGVCILSSALAAFLGVLLRQELARRHFNMFFLPFAAALLGALVGDLAILGRWTRTPDLCLLVPSLVLVPGVHLLNAAYDLFDNRMPMALARAALSTSILGAIAFGLLIGAAAGFGAYFNVPRRLLWACVACGVVAHATRYAGIASDLGLVWSTLIASAAVGILTSLLRERFHAPFAAIAFGAVVPLVPGSLIFRAASGTFQLLGDGASASPQHLVEVSVAGLQALLVLLAIAVGLLTPVVLVRRSPPVAANPARLDRRP